MASTRITHVFADDPRQLECTKNISPPHPVYNQDRLQGYLYVIIGGEQYDSILTGLQSSQSMREFALFRSGLPGVLADRRCWCCFAILLRPLKRLSDEMERVRAKPISIVNGCSEKPGQLAP